MNNHPDLTPDTLHGISVLETGDKKLYLAVYVMKEHEEDQDYLAGHFALTIFAGDVDEAKESAEMAETDAVELVQLVGVKDILKQAIEQDRQNPDLRGKWN